MHAMERRTEVGRSQFLDTILSFEALSSVDFVLAVLEVVRKGRARLARLARLPESG